MVRHENLGPVRNQNPGLWHAPLHQRLNFLNQIRYIESHTIADDAGGMLVKHAGWKKVKGKLAVIIDNGMACITSALETDDNVRLLGKHIRNLTLSFVTPVSTYNCSNHTKILLRVSPVQCSFAVHERMDTHSCVSYPYLIYYNLYHK